MAIKEIGAALDRVARNTINDNFKSQDGRIDNLVLQAGDAHPELQDAHYSGVKGQTFATVGKRFDAVEQQAITDKSTANSELQAGLALKRDKSVMLTQADMSTASEAHKLTMNHLSQEVKNSITGTAPVSPNIADGQVTSEKLATNAITNKVKSAEIFNKTFKKTTVNSNNILSDCFLDETYGHVSNIEISNSIFGSNVVVMTPDEVASSENSFRLKFPNFNTAFVEAKTIFIHFKAKVEKTALSGYDTPSITFYQYLGNSLKGAKSTSLSITSDYKKYTIQMDFASGASAFDNFKIQNNKKFVLSIKDVMINSSASDNIFSSSETNVSDKLNVAIIGDSLSDADIAPYGKWFTHLKDYNIRQLAKSGSGFFNPSSHQTQFYNQANSVLATDDIVLIFGSFNDMSRLNAGEVTMGTLGDTSLATIHGCIAKTLDNIYKINESAIVVLVTPTPWTGMNEQIEQNNPFYPHVHGYIQALHDVAKKRQIPILDLFHTSGLRPWVQSNRESYFHNSDGTHPNDAGHRRYIYPQMKMVLDSLNWKL